MKFHLDYILEKEDPRDAIEALDTLPKDIPDAYKEVLLRIDKIKGKQTALKVLSWLFYAQRPMTIDEIREVLSIRLSDTKLCAQYFINPVQIIHYCQGLVGLDYNNGIIRFTHCTVREYLTENYQDKLLAPTHLAKMCLTYLTLDFFEEDPRTNRRSFIELTKSYRFIDYAIRYWGFYVRGKGEEDSEIIARLLNLFKSSYKRNALAQYQTWIERIVDFHTTPYYCTRGIECRLQYIHFKSSHERIRRRGFRIGHAGFTRGN